MDSYCSNRLLVIGPGRDLNRFFRDDRWMGVGSARHFEIIEHAPGRHAWQFNSDGPPLLFLRTVSRQWPALTLLLDYDSEDQRLKGLVKARNGRLRHFRASY
jgi:hypothetical protein